ncbi:MAG: pyridoxamine 5'-phosphate oxidase family protein [Acidobacteria bacterium]|nr:pyridoxamine 5'-phosphate oxidase family protein [Acidobacteriota bacterium]
MKNIRMRIPALLVCLALAAGCATAPPPPEARGTVPQLWPGSIAGYLTKEEVPDSLALVPPPPAPGSGALSADEEANRAGRALRGTPRFAQATEDANLTFPGAAGSLACAVGAPITEQDTPHLYVLLRRVLSDAGYSTGAAKNKYMRKRPFLVNGEPTCTPADEKDLAKQGSYPSGHAAAGWAWALVLAEVAPDRAEAVVERGRAFGQSRVVCNVHWQADVNEGRILGAATVARLHADAAFLADLAAAKKELAAVRAKNAVPDRDCPAEAAALATALPAAVAASPAAPMPVAEPKAVLKAAREIALKARYATLVTIGPDGQPQSRVVDALGPDEDFTVWIATNPATRKVADLARDPRATLQFFEASLPAYVTLVGTASLVADPEVKALHWKDDWGPFYKDKSRGADFALFKFVPKRLEVVSQAHGLVNDPKTWRPVSVEFSAKTP